MISDHIVLILVLLVSGDQSIKEGVDINLLELLGGFQSLRHFVVSRERVIEGDDFGSGHPESVKSLSLQSLFGLVDVSDLVV